MRSLVALVALLLPLHGLAAAGLEARVVVKGTALGIPWAVVTLDAEPRDGVPDAQGTTDARGEVLLGGLPAGSYHLEAFHPSFVTAEVDLALADGATRAEKVELAQLAAAAPPQTFQLWLAVSDVRTHLGLPDAKLTVERFADATGAGAPVFSRTVNGDGLGRAILAGLAPGNYRVTVKRPGWQDYVEPAAGTFQIARNTSLTMVMKPLGRKLRVEVRGFDPVSESSFDLYMKDAWVELTGLDFTSDTEVVPTRTFRTNADGILDFPDLAAIRWRVRVKRHGYRAQEKIFFCSAAELVQPMSCDRIVVDTSGVHDYRGWLVDVTLPFVPASLKVTLSSPQYVNAIARTAVARLYGMEKTPTEGIVRFATVVNDPVEGPTATFRDLLPGRYRAVAVMQSALGSNGNVQGNPAPLRAAAYQGTAYIDSERWEKVIEVNQGQAHVESATLKTRPVTIRGRLLAADALVPGNETLSNARQIYTPKSSSSVTFKLHHSTAPFKPGEPTSFTVATDAAGFFTATLPPALYGVQIPDLTEHAGFRARIRARGPAPWTTYDDTTVGWPYPDPWPWTGFEDSLHAPWLAFSSGAEYDVDLLVHRHFVELAGDLTLTEGYSAVRMTDAVTFQAPDILSGTAVRVAGPSTLNVPVTRDTQGSNAYRVPPLGPGVWAFSVSHPRYTNSSTFSLTVPAWGRPGFAPPQDPEQVAFPIPAWRYRAVDPNTFAPLSAENVLMLAGYASAEQRLWYDPMDGNPAYYLPPSGITAGFFVELPHRPGEIFEAGFGSQPDPPCTMHVVMNISGTDYWTTRACRSDRRYEFFNGGPSNDMPSNPTPPWATGFPLQVRARLADGSELSGLLLQLASGAQVTSGTTTTVNETGEGATAVAPGWAVLSEVCVPTSSPRGMACDYNVQRRMGASGHVQRSATEPLQGAVVRVYDGAGNVLAQTSTNAAGNWALTTQQEPSAMPVWVDVRLPGYTPQRKRYDVTPTQIDVTGVVTTLVPLPAPTISTFTLNRYGNFLPGVTRAANMAGFSPSAALDNLTATARVEATAPAVSYALDGFSPTGAPAGVENVNFADAIESVYLIDRRLFVNRTTNEDLSPPLVPVSELAEPAGLMKFLNDAQAGTRAGQPLHAMVSRAQPVAGAPGAFEVKFPVSELPPGLFDPVAVVVTKFGAVGVLDYAPPGAEKPLYGVAMPPWALFLTDVLGVLGSVPATVDLKEVTPDGKFSATPEYTAELDLSPSNYLTYNYGITAKFTEGSPAPGAGLFGLGNRTMGLAVAVKATFKLDGKGQEVSLNGEFGLSQPWVEKEKAHLFGMGAGVPAVAGKVSIEDITPEVSGSVSKKEVFGPGVFPEMAHSVALQGTMGLEIGVDVTPLASKLPYIGPVILIASKADKLKIKGVFVTTTGGNFETTWKSKYEPTAGGTSTSAQPPMETFLGTTERSSQITILWRVGGGLKVELGEEDDPLTAKASVIFQIGAPANKPGPGVAIKLAQSLKWPPIEQIEGAASIVLQFNAAYRGVGWGKRWQWDLARIDWQAGSEPYLELVEDKDDLVLYLPQSAPPAAWSAGAGGGLLVDALYPPSQGGVGVGAGGAGTLVYVQTTPGSDAMTVQLSRLGADGSWGQPVQVTPTGVVLAAASLQRADGQTLVVLSEIDAAQLGNPDAPGRLTWALVPAAPEGPVAVQPLAQTTGAAERLYLARAGDGAVLAFVDERTGARTLKAAHFDGASWKPEVALSVPGAARARALAGHPGAAEALYAQVDDTGALQMQAFDGTAWTAQAVTTASLDAVDVAFAADGSPVLATVSDQNGVELFRRPGGSWQLLGALPVNDRPAEVRVLPVTDGAQSLLLVGWLEPGQQNSFRYAWVSEAGAVVEGPHTAWSLGGELLSDLALVPDPVDRLGARALFTRASSGRKSLVEQKLVFGQVPVDPGPSPEPPGPGTDGGTEEPPPAAKPCGCASGPDLAALAGVLLLLRWGRGRRRAG